MTNSIFDQGCLASDLFQELALMDALTESARGPRNDELAAAFGKYLRGKSSREHTYRNSDTAIKAWRQSRHAALGHGTFVDALLMADLRATYRMHCRATRIPA